MDPERSAVDAGPPTPEGIGSEWAAFIQQQIQLVFQAAIPHIVQQISDRALVPPSPVSPSAAVQRIDRASHGTGQYRDEDFDGKESKVAEPEKFSGKKGGEVYKWFAQLRLVFRGKPRTYRRDEDKITFALSYMTGAAQNWAMPILQALDEGRPHALLVDYDGFRESVIAVYGDMDRRSNAEDRLGKIKQTGSVAMYISMFNEHAAQVDWNESSLVARFRGGLKDDVLDSIATAEAQPRGLQEWMAMASRIDERLWVRRQNRRPPIHSSNSRDPAGRFQATSGTSRPTSGPTPMEIDAIRGTTALAKTAAERLEYQRQGKCWGCGKPGHIRAKCPTNPSKPLSLAVLEEDEPSESGKDGARD